MTSDSDDKDDKNKDSKPKAEPSLSDFFVEDKKKKEKDSKSKSTTAIEDLEKFAKEGKLGNGIGTNSAVTASMAANSRIRESMTDMVRIGQEKLRREREAQESIHESNRGIQNLLVAANKFLEEFKAATEENNKLASKMIKNSEKSNKLVTWAIAISIIALAIPIFSYFTDNSKEILSSLQENQTSIIKVQEDQTEAQKRLGQAIKSSNDAEIEARLQSATEHLKPSNWE